MTTGRSAALQPSTRLGAGECPRACLPLEVRIHPPRHQHRERPTALDGWLLLTRVLREWARDARDRSSLSSGPSSTRSMSARALCRRGIVPFEMESRILRSLRREIPASEAARGPTKARGAESVSRHYAVCSVSMHRRSGPWSPSCLGISHHVCSIHFLCKRPIKWILARHPSKASPRAGTACPSPSSASRTCRARPRSGGPAATPPYPR